MHDGSGGGVAQGGGHLVRARHPARLLDEMGEKRSSKIGRERRSRVEKVAENTDIT